MPGDKEKRAIPRTPLRHSRGRGNQEKNKARHSPPSQSKGGRERSEQGDARRRGEARNPPSFPRTPPSHSRKPHVIPADAGTKRKTKHATHPLRKAKGDASAASRGMPGDEEKRPPPPKSFPRNPRHSRKPHVIPADAGTKRKTKHATHPLRKAKGDASAASRGMPGDSRRSAQSPVIPADAGTQKNKARLFSRSEGARERSDSRGCPVPTRRGQPSSDEAHESTHSPTLASPQSKPHHPRNTPSSKSAPPPSTGR